MIRAYQVQKISINQYIIIKKLKIIRIRAMYIMDAFLHIVFYRNVIEYRFRD